MNAAKLIDKLTDVGISVRVDHGKLRLKHPKPLSDEQLEYLKAHKQAIINYLIPSNQPRYNRYAYRFTLSDDKGGTYITDCPHEEAKQELINMFIGREIKTMDLLN